MIVIASNPGLSYATAATPQAGATFTGSAAPPGCHIQECCSDMRPHQDLDQRIDALLADGANADNPLRPALEEIWQLLKEHTERLNGVTDLAESFAIASRERPLTLRERLDRHLRKVQKIARVSNRYRDMLRDLNDALREASTHDVLTGLANRRLLMDRLREEADRSARLGYPFVLALVDVDYFKRINDSLGHDAGDHVLRVIAECLQQGLREYDVCGRWGGEEFLLILPHTLIDDALTVVNRLHEDIRRLRFVEDQRLSLTASIGVACHQPGASFADTLTRADDALRDAKNQGRNCVLSAEG